MATQKLPTPRELLLAQSDAHRQTLKRWRRLVTTAMSNDPYAHKQGVCVVIKTPSSDIALDLFAIECLRSGWEMTFTLLEPDTQGYLKLTPVPLGEPRVLPL